MEIQELIKRSIMRGGTSKAIFLLRNDLPKDEKLRDKVICRIFGAPDPREIEVSEEPTSGVTIVVTKPQVFNEAIHCVI